MAGPWIAAMTGNGRFRMACMPPLAVSMNLRNSRTPIAGMTSISSRSNPAQKARVPAPVTISARSPLSRRNIAAVTWSVNICTVCEFIRSGRLILSTPMEPSMTSRVSCSRPGTSTGTASYDFSVLASFVMVVMVTSR